MNVQIFDPIEIEAAERGEIEGDFYLSDGEVWVSELSLLAFRGHAILRRDAAASEPAQS
jgi:hypothetical protein